MKIQKNFKQYFQEKISRGESKLSYSELYTIISKPWINTHEIQVICQCGQKMATKIRKNIEEEVEKMGKHLPISAKKVVPTPLLLKYLNISENYVYEMAKKEKTL